MKGHRLCVAVSGIHAGENAQPGPGVIRALRAGMDEPIRVVGLAFDAFDSSLYAPGLLDDGFLLPYPSTGPEAYLQRLLEIDRECGIDAVLPCLDVELPVLQSLAPQLEKAGIGCVLPSRRALAVRRKDTLVEFAESAGILTPETRILADSADLERAMAAFGFPMLIKGPVYEADVVHGEADARTAFERIGRTWGRPLLAQRFVRGEEYNVALVGDGQGGSYGAVAMRKTIVTRLGKAWGAMTVDDPALLDFARHIVARLAWYGGCEVELLRTPAGKLYLVEVNPRLPAWIYLSAAAGCNLPTALLELSLGRVPAPLGSPRAGVFYVRHAAEVVGDMGDIEALYAAGGRTTRPPPPLPSRDAAQAAE